MRNPNLPPPVRGGQGRTAADLIASADWLIVLAIVAVIVMIVTGVMQ